MKHCILLWCRGLFFGLSILLTMGCEMRQVASPKPSTIKIGVSTGLEVDPIHFEGVQSEAVAQLLYRNLFTTTEPRIELIQPDLAAGLPLVGRRGLRYRIKLRAQQTFSDGTPITAAEVVKELNRLTKEGPHHDTWSAMVKSVRPGRHDEIVIELKKPNPYFLLALTSPAATIAKISASGVVGSGAYAIQTRGAKSWSLVSKEAGLPPVELIMEPNARQALHDLASRRIQIDLVSGIQKVNGTKAQLVKMDRWAVSFLFFSPHSRLSAFEKIKFKIGQRLRQQDFLDKTFQNPAVSTASILPAVFGVPLPSRPEAVDPAPKKIHLKMAILASASEDAFPHQMQEVLAKNGVQLQLKSLSTAELKNPKLERQFDLWGAMVRSEFHTPLEYFQTCLALTPKSRPTVEAKVLLAKIMHSRGKAAEALLPALNRAVLAESSCIPLAERPVFARVSQNLKVKNPDRLDLLQILRQ